jgi:AcrR family transcriptional regulator
MNEPGHSEGSRGTDTRTRIQQVAVELFTENGYEKTSLREIAERLGVTKAALYYHFKSKEDIVVSLVEDYYGRLDALLAWARAQPRTPATRGEVLSRYMTILAEGDAAFRMLHQNQAAVQHLASTQGKGRGELFRERITGLIDVLTVPGADLPGRVRAAMALGGVSIGWMFLADEADDRRQLCAAILEVASDLAGAQPAPGAVRLRPVQAGPAPAATARTSGSTR